VLRRPLDWFMRNVRDVGSHDSIPIELERNREAAVERGAQNPPDLPLYMFRLGLRAGFSGDQPARVPAFRKVNPHPHPVLKEIFYCEVAGTVLEAANVHALKQKVAQTLETIAPGKSLPLAYFRVPPVDYSLPVYEDGGQIVCPVLAGPKIKAADLAEMRRHVTRYLVNAGYVADDSQVELRVLRPSDLKLVPPAAIIQSIDRPELWIPTVEGHSSEGLVVGVLGESTELHPEERRRAGIQPLASPPAASDIISLLRLVGNGLVETSRIEDQFSLYAGRVRPEIWARTEQLTEDVGRKLACWLEDEEPIKLELPLRRTAAGELLTALEDQGICVFFEADESALASRVGRYLSGSGFLRWGDTVEVVAAEHQEEAAPDAVLRRDEIDFPRLDIGSSSEEGERPRVEELFERHEDKREVGLP
jgi:hypothetical protein